MENFTKWLWGFVAVVDRAQILFCRILIGRHILPTILAKPGEGLVVDGFCEHCMSGIKLFSFD